MFLEAFQRGNLPPLMKKALERFGSGNIFIKWVQIIYNNSTAEILTNRNISKPINISNGCWQGSPLLPLLLTIAIESFAIAIHCHSQFCGITIGPVKHRIALYVDNVMFLMPSLSKSIPALIQLIRYLRVYKVNHTKSSILLLNSNERKNPIAETI